MEAEIEISFQIESTGTDESAYNSSCPYVDYDLNKKVTSNRKSSTPFRKQNNRKKPRQNNYHYLKMAKYHHYIRQTKQRY